MKKRRKRTPEEHQARQLLRQQRKIDQEKARRAALRWRIAQRVLLLCMTLIPALSLLIPADRFLSGLIGIALMLAEAIALIVFHLFNSLWIKYRTAFLVNQFCAAALITLMSNIERTVLSAIPAAAALGLFIPLAAGWAALALRRRKENAPFTALACALLLLPIALFSAQSANVALDRQIPTEIQASVLDSRSLSSGRGGTRKEIKLGLPEDNGVIRTHWFTVQKTLHFDTLRAQEEAAVLRHEGAFGAVWYEIRLPE